MKNRHIKTDFPDQVKWLTGSGAVMEDYFKFRGWRSITRTVGYDWVQLNHYAVKSVDSYAIRKLRGNVNNKADKYNSDYWSLQDRNEERCDTMLRYSEKRSRILLQLLEDPELNRLHHAALARAEARLAELQRLESYDVLVADLVRASLVPIDRIVARPPQPRDREKIAALMSTVEKQRNATAKAARKVLKPALAASANVTPRASGELGLSAGPSLDWVENHGVKLPVDPGVFSATALVALRNGKFERGLARKLPQVFGAGEKLLTIGTGLGFHAVNIAAVRADLTLVLQEDDPALRRLFLQVCAQNNRDFDARFVASEVVLGDDPASAIAALVATLRPDSLLLSDPRLHPDLLKILISSFPADPPVQIIILGRLLEKYRDALDEAKAFLILCGYEPTTQFAPDIALHYRFNGADLDDRADG